MQVSTNIHNFRFRVPELHIENLSNRCRRVNYTIFKILFLAGFCNLAQLCAAAYFSTRGERTDGWSKLSAHFLEGL